MIPYFPEFKKLELADREHIEEFTMRYPPYSDFDFISMWSWNIQEEMKVSQHNHNLIVRFTDYITGKPFYSFLGSNQVNETALALLNLSIQEGLEPNLKLVPEDAIRELDRNHFKVEEDRDNHDYIISVERLLPHEGTERKLSSRRRLLKKFKDNNTVELLEIDIYDPTIQNQINEVFVKWERQLDYGSNDVEHLRYALQRIFLLKNNKSIKSFGAFINNKLIGYSINGLCPGGYAIGHFQQGNIKVFEGIYALLMHDAAPFFRKYGCAYINLEQDLNISGLRKWKSSLIPVAFLKKYFVYSATV